MNFKKEVENIINQYLMDSGVLRQEVPGIIDQITELHNERIKEIVRQIEDSTCELQDKIYELSESLQVTHFRNGDEIPEVINNKEWFETTEPARCWYNNDPDIGIMLYNWYAVNDSRKIAPQNEHIPSDEEWVRIIKNIRAKNKILACPGYYRHGCNGCFYGLSYATIIWSTTSIDAKFARSINLYREDYRAFRYDTDFKQFGFPIYSVRKKS